MSFFKDIFRKTKQEIEYMFFTAFTNGKPFRSNRVTNGNPGVHPPKQQSFSMRKTDSLRPSPCLLFCITYITCKVLVSASVRSVPMYQPTKPVRVDCPVDFFQCVSHQCLDIILRGPSISITFTFVDAPMEGRSPPPAPPTVLASSSLSGSSPTE